MTRNRLTAAIASAAMCGTALLAVATPAEAAAKTFKNCTAMHKVYKHGVGKPGARDKTSGRPVTTFKKSKAIYDKNKKSDRDKDGIACEQA